MEGVKMNFMIPVSHRLVKSLLAAHHPANTSLQLATTPVMVLQDVPDKTVNLIQVSSSDVIVRNVNLNLPVSNVQQPCSSLRSVRNVHPPKTLESSQNNCDEEESTSDIEEIEVLPSTKYIQPSATKILSSGKNATVQKIIESLPKEPEVITIDEPNEPAHKKGGKPGKNLKETHFKCDICDEEFKKRYLYQRHMHEHSQEKPHHCPKCSASFNVPTNFTLHMATHNIGEPKCPMCNKRFARIASLKTHMVMHEKDENLYCPECDGVFETKSQLETHMKLHDTDKWPSEDYRRCKLCRAKFTHPALYRQHLRDHYKVQTKIERLTKHGIVRQRIINSCRICKKSFEKPSQLARHLRVHTGEKPYKCNLCNRGFTQKGSLKIHMWQHEGNRPHGCAFCSAKFSQKGNLKTHIQKTHKVQKGSPVYRCTNCSCIFRTLGSLNNHMNRVHGADMRQNKEVAEKNREGEEAEDNDDEICFEMDQNENRARNGNSTRRSAVDEDDVGGNEKVEGDGDTNLEEGFVVMDNEETAMVTVLDKASSEVEKKYVKIKQRYVNNCKVYVCSYCDKDFKKPSDLMRHLRVHTMEKPFKCKVCKRGFTLKATLLVHERVHKREERFRCQICSATWRSEKELNDHEKIHLEHYVCGLCEKQLPNFKALKTHTMTEHEIKKPKKQVSEEARNIAKKVQLKDPLELKVASNGLLLAEPKHRNDLVNGRGRPHKCPSCPAAFMKLSHLKQHHRKHTGERPFECYLCNKKFTTVSALNCHARTHECTKPFKCPVCSVHFTTNSSMKRHLVTHTNKRPYMCPYCNKTFKTTVNCRKHIKIHKMEIAEEELAKQTRGDVSTPTDEPAVITLKDGVTTIQPILIQSEPLLQPTEAQKNQPFVSVLPATQNVLTIGQNLSIVNNPNIGTAQKHLANETGTVTLVSYPSGQPFTPDNIKALEDSLNQQLLSINMNLQNQGASVAQNPPVLSIIYNDAKTYETQINSSANTNNFASQVNTFDINQMTLQTIKNEIEMEINPATSTSMTNILPGSLQENSNSTQPATIQFDLTNLKNEISSSNQATNVGSRKGNQSPENQVMDDINLQCHMCQKRDFTTETLKEHLKTHQGTREYECTYCLSKFCSSGGLSRHMKIHETPEKHKCYDCKQEFTTSRELTVHIKEHVRQELEQKNAIGPNETIDVGLKDENDKKNNECAYCSKIFRKPSDLVRHIRTHTGERPYQCPHCDKSFAVKCTLDSHVKAHVGVKEFHCYVCNNAFATKGSLKVHMRLHTGDRPFKCDMCDAKFRTSGHRKVHMVSHARQNARKSPNQNKNLNSPNSTTETSNECSPAQMTMNSELVPSQPNNQIVPNQYDNLTIDHTLNTITLNSVNDQITFNTDGTILNDGSGLLNLNDNNQLVANLQYFLSNGMVSVQVDNPTISPQLPTPAVDINPSDFEQIDTSDAQKPMSDSEMVFAPQNLNPNLGMTNVNNFDLESCTVLHMDDAGSLSDPVKEKRYKQPKTPNPVPRRECDICGKVFAKPCQVERHKRVHTGERPYKCDLCTKSFAQKSTLQVHKKHHSGDRPYPCPQCERSFTQSGNLHTHLKRVHKLDSADAKRLIKPQSANCDAKLSVDDIFIDFSLADLLR